MPTALIRSNTRFFVALSAAVLQGLLLLWLHTRIQDAVWPATDLSWLMAMYSVGVFVPLTIQLLSEHWHTRLLWWVTAALGVLFAYFGWNFGVHAGTPVADKFIETPAVFIFAATLVLIWLL